MSTKLPDAKWRARTGLDVLLEVLGATTGETRFVGGAVRDTLLGLDVNDIDLATQRRPEEVMAGLRAAGIKAIPTGIAHGTITAVLPEGSVEITTLRRDVSTDGRRATVAFTDVWEEDAARRDFTLNALSADPITGSIHDYFGGLTDLKARRVRFIGAPLARIAEDHLRILRFFRFHARFGQGAPDAAALAACTARANDLMALSRERIADELLKILCLPNPTPTVALMIAHGILAPVLPEITTAAGLEAIVASETKQALPADALRRLASLLPANAELAENVAARLKLSKANRKLMLTLGGRQRADAARPLALAYEHGAAAATSRLLLSDAPIDALRGWVPPRFPLSGGDLIARGLAAGPRVAQALQHIEREWVAAGFPDHIEVERIAQRVLSSHANLSEG